MLCADLAKFLSFQDIFIKYVKTDALDYDGMKYMVQNSGRMLHIYMETLSWIGPWHASFMDQ